MSVTISSVYIIIAGIGVGENGNVVFERVTSKILIHMITGTKAP